MVDQLSHFLFQPVLHDWCNKGHGICFPVCGIVHIKERLLLFGKSSPCGGSGFHLSLSEWSFTICPTPYNCKSNVLSASLNKTFHSLPCLVPMHYGICSMFLTSNKERKKNKNFVKTKLYFFLANKTHSNSTGFSFVNLYVPIIFSLPQYCLHIW